jgi:hypothetical protein
MGSNTFPEACSVAGRRVPATHVAYHAVWSKLLLVAVVVLSALQPTAVAVKLHFTKNEAKGKVVYSVADVKVDMPPPPAGTVLVVCLSGCHNTVRRVSIRSTWAKFPGT